MVATGSLLVYVGYLSLVLRPAAALRCTACGRLKHRAALALGTPMFPSPPSEEAPPALSSRKPMTLWSQVSMTRAEVHQGLPPVRGRRQDLEGQVRQETGCSSSGDQLVGF